MARTINDYHFLESHDGGDTRCNLFNNADIRINAYSSLPALTRASSCIKEQLVCLGRWTQGHYKKGTLDIFLGASALSPISKPYETGSKHFEWKEVYKRVFCERILP